MPGLKTSSADSALLWTLWSALTRHIMIILSIETHRDPNFYRFTEENRAYLKVLLTDSESDTNAEVERHVARLETFDQALRPRKS